MLISNQSPIFIITALAAAAIALCYLPILLNLFSLFIEHQKGKALGKRLEQKLKQSVEQNLLTHTQNTLNEVGKEFKKILAEQLSAMGTAIKGDYEKNRQELKTATDNYLEETKIALHDVVENAEKRVNDKLTKELEATLAGLKNYKEGRLKKIDDEIAAIVEKTIYLTLGKALSLKDHTDIIYESLAEAKEEGFFGKNAD